MSRSPEEAAAVHHREVAEFSPEERALLLELAHNSILGAFEGAVPVLNPVAPHLNEPRGAFTTIYLHGELRGCIGYVQAVAPLYQSVLLTARAAALEDPRFPPVNQQEAAEVTVSLSILSSLRNDEPEEVEVGRHGLVITFGERRGLLLPQVAVEHQWGRETFLGQACRKAGLVPDAWKRGASIQVFTAEHFSDNDPQE